MMPDGDTVDGVKEAIRRYRKFKNSYPYQKYINWDFALTSEEQRSKNLLGSDAELQEILQEAHSNKLLEFIETSQKVVVVVDGSKDIVDDDVLRNKIINSLKDFCLDFIF